MLQNAFFEQVRDHGGIGAEDVEKAVSAVFSTLGELLTADETAALAAHVPEPAAQWLRARPRARSMDLDDVYARVAERMGLAPARALEITQVVCRVLAVSLHPEVRSRLMTHLGPVMGRLFEIPVHGSPSQRPVHLSAPPPSGAGHTLATGRPGSLHPLSEAHADNAHTHSVARSDNPHADSKLSSAPGLTQEILHETLAEGKPGPARKVSDTQD